MTLKGEGRPGEARGGPPAAAPLSGAAHACLWARRPISGVLCKAALHAGHAIAKQN